MIVKSLSRSGQAGQKGQIGQLVQYIFKYILKEEKQLPQGKAPTTKAKSTPPFIIRHNIKSRSIDGYIRQFKDNELRRIHTRRDQTCIHHTILSWNSKDREHITDKMLRDISKEYIRLRGDNNLYVGTKHVDREHIHLHIAMSGTQLNGLSSRISRQQFADLKLALDAYQKEKYPELIHSLPRHGRSKERAKAITEPVIDRRNGRISQKETLLKALEAGYEKSKSIDAFLTTLKAQGYEPYYRAGRLTGVRSEDGLKFRLNRLGYGEDKIARLDAVRAKEEKELAELRDIRARQSREREQDDDRASRGYERDIEKDDDQDRRSIPDVEKENQEKEEYEEERDDQNGQDDDMR